MDQHARQALAGLADILDRILLGEQVTEEEIRQARDAAWRLVCQED